MTPEINALQLDAMAEDFACFRCECVIGPWSREKFKQLRQSPMICDSCLEDFRLFCKANIGLLRSTLEAQCGARLDAYARGEETPDGLRWHWQHRWDRSESDVRARFQAEIIDALSDVIYDGGKEDDELPPMGVSGWWGDNHIEAVRTALAKIVTPDWTTQFIESVYALIPPGPAFQALVAAAIGSDKEESDAAMDWIDGAPGIDEPMHVLIFLRTGHEWIFTDIDDSPSKDWLLLGDQLPPDFRLMLERIKLANNQPRSIARQVWGPRPDELQEAEETAANEQWGKAKFVSTDVRIPHSNPKEPCP